MKLLNNLFVTVLLLSLGFVLVGATQVKPFVEVVGTRKHLWKQKIKQRPQFMQVILEWSSRKQEPLPGV